MLVAHLGMQSSWSEGVGLNGLSITHGYWSPGRGQSQGCGGQVFETEPSRHNLSQELLVFNLAGEWSSAECLAVMGGALIPTIHILNCQPSGPRLELCLRSGSGGKRSHSSVLDQGQNQSRARGKI